MKDFWTKNKKNPWFWLFSIFLLLTAVAMPLMSLDAGNSGDEDGFHVIQGRHVVNFYETHGKDTTCLSFLQDYPSSPDVIAEFFNRKLGVEDINITRHIFNSLLGWLSILAV